MSLGRHRVRTFVAAVRGPLAVLALVLGVLLGAPSEAKLQPYYVVRGVGTTRVRPRVLFVLDTSGSMGWRAQASDEQCSWNSCENGSGTSQSRIAAARNAVKTVVSAIGNDASFALMTFDAARPPTTVPSKCADGNRFAWATQYGYFTWANISKYSGYSGSWRLCEGTKRPYPYLRYDELGVGSVITADNQTGAVPASPLISTTSANMKSTTNAQRRVQWFPKFMGVRVNLNDTTDPGGTILAKTIGDWGSTSATRASAVKGHDFYYWPYVDGFPGYAVYVGYPADAHASSYPLLGTTESTGAAQATLYAPFYVDLPSLAAADRGPASETAAREAVLSAVSPFISGGIDAEGGTPWASSIGKTSDTAVESNAVYAQPTVASYLKFLKNAGDADVCAPTSAVLITDGVPSPSSEGGATLYGRLAALRRDLDVKLYVVGMFLAATELQNMACASAGACDGTCSTPCDDTPAHAWDTCADKNNPATGCAYLAGSVSELNSVLTRIVAAALALDVDAGPGATINDFGVGAGGEVGHGDIVQTSVRGWTEWPSWKGHVARALCSDTDPDDPGKPAPWCVDPGFATDELTETFGPCPQGRSWDAGECLQQTAWDDRRVFSYGTDHQVFAVAIDGQVTAEFKAALIATGAMTSSEANASAQSVAEFALGKGFPDDWKLPGLADSAPVVVRRIPKLQPELTPSVPIRDPHCAGRRLSSVDASGLPDSLEQFARASWGPATEIDSPSPHREYQEAVLVGDDLGMLHAFQFDSGNELWGLIPRNQLVALVAKWRVGAATMGQSADVTQHRYGIAATVNQGWVYDGAAASWRHLGVFGFGAGGTELVALDLSHMSPMSDRDPFTVLWSSEDATLSAAYDAYAGYTWARPALTYEVPNNVLAVEPRARLVFGTGYTPAGAATSAGRTLMVADAVTGEILEHATIASVPSAYGTSYGTVVDPAIASHCISRYWGEVEEAYVVDPAGQLFRWDVGGAHAADSGGVWGTSAIAVTQFLACEGAGTCTVGTSGKGEPFAYGPAVTANGRIDGPGGGQSGELPAGMDQFLIALASGSPADDAIDISTSTFHASLYLLVDDHSSGDRHGGFDIPAGAPKVDPSALATYPHYARVAVTDLTRTRTFTPYPGASSYTETAKFSRATRPIRSPRIEVRGAVDDDGGAGGTPIVIEGVEVIDIVYTLYEPPSASCDARWYDRSAGVWHFDEGASYEVRLRVTALDNHGFDFTSGAAGGPADFGQGVATGLTLHSISQVSDGECADGSCGPQLAAPHMAVCDNNVGMASTAGMRGLGLTTDRGEILGFSPIE